MPVREILLLGNPLLRAHCEKVENFSDPGLHTVIADLFDTLADFRRKRGFGRGIAAPQIGALKKITVLNVDRPVTLINPEIVKRSRRKMMLWDDCFSFPDLMVKVERHVNVTVDYCDERGRGQRMEAEGSLSELLQHEIDHLNGVLAVDRAIDSKHIVLRSEWEKLEEVSRKTLAL
jgi:peptide deformylase